MAGFDKNSIMHTSSVYAPEYRSWTASPKCLKFSKDLFIIFLRESMTWILSEMERPTKERPACEWRSWQMQLQI